MSHLEKINEFHLNFIKKTPMFCTIPMTLKYDITELIVDATFLKVWGKLVSIADDANRLFRIAVK